MTNFCPHGNDPSGSIKGGKFLNQLKEYQLPNKDSALILLRRGRHDFHVKWFYAFRFVLSKSLNTSDYLLLTASSQLLRLNMYICCCSFETLF
jgi:predicted acyltransferase